MLLDRSIAPDTLTWKLGPLFFEVGKNCHLDLSLTAQPIYGGIAAATRS